MVELALHELRTLQSQLEIPTDRVLAALSATDCKIIGETGIFTDPELRLLARSVYMTRDFNRLLKQFLQPGDVILDIDWDDVVLLFIIPHSYVLTHSVVRSLIYSTLNAVTNRKLVAENFQQMQQRISLLEAEISKMHSTEKMRIQQIIDDWSAGVSGNVVIHENLLEAFTNQVRENIRQRLDATLRFLQFIHPNAQEIQISKDHLTELPAVRVAVPQVTDKARQLLNRYEGVARKLAASDRIVNGKSIAATCEPPISAPALTDSLKKRRVQIERLLSQEPESWPIARVSLKMLRQMDEKRKYSAA